MGTVLIIAGRVAGLASALFLGAFALDAFSPGLPLTQNLVGLVIHLLPSAVLIAFFVVSWRWPVAGGVLFLIAALMPFVLLANAVWVNVLIAALPGLAGVLLVAGAGLARHG